MANTCPHTEGVKEDIAENSKECEDCVAAGKKDWVQVRVCMTCGHAGGCDSSPSMHAREHFKKTGHPIIRDMGSTWKWCYTCNDYV